MSSNSTARIQHVSQSLLSQIQHYYTEFIPDIFHNGPVAPIHKFLGEAKCFMPKTLYHRPYIEVNSCAKRY